MKHNEKRNYIVEVAYLNTDTDEINIDYVEAWCSDAKWASDSAIEYIDRLPFTAHITVISVQRK